MQKKIKLIHEAYAKDSLGQYVAEETVRTVWANVDSVSGAAWADAGVLGIQASFEVFTPKVNYKGEKLVEIDGQRYAVYRTYETEGDEIELYLQAEVGVSNG